MRDEKTLVSVIIPVYNRADLVNESVKSVLAQTYRNIEVVLINDGSTDNSLDVISLLQEEYPDLITIINQKNQGQAAARNHGIEKARGSYIAFLDSDDLWMPDKLERQIPLFRDRVGLVYSSVELIDGLGKHIRYDYCDPEIQGNIYHHLLVKNRMTGGTVVVLKSVLKEVGLFDTEFSAAENWDLWLRICKKYEARLVISPLLKYRLHNNNMSKDSVLMLNAKRKIINKHCDKKSVDPLVSKYSKIAETDYNYKLGVHCFSGGEYRSAARSFIKVSLASPLYEDTPIRLARCMLGRRGNQMIRAIKKSI